MDGAPKLSRKSGPHPEDRSITTEAAMVDKQFEKGRS